MTRKSLLNVVFLILVMASGYWLCLFLQDQSTEEVVIPPSALEKIKESFLQDLKARQINLKTNEDDQKEIRSRRNLLTKISPYTPPVLKEIREMVEKKVSYDSPQLIQLVRRLLDRPSDKSIVKMSRGLMKTPQAEVIDSYLKEKRNGFFVEVGALDGERSSNTLFLEKKRNWTGLLIEMDPYFYLQLLGKNRKSYSINSCLSPYPHPTLITFHEDESGRGKIELNKGDTLPDESKSTTIPCFPLSTLLLALNVTHVDYFSLDVEGVELPILKTIVPNRKFSFDMMSVEYGHGDKALYKEFMQRWNYTVVKDIDYARPEQSLYVVDFIFARTGLKL